MTGVTAADWVLLIVEFMAVGLALGVFATIARAR